MRIFYAYPEPLTPHRPRHLQVWSTCRALAGHFEVVLAAAERNEFGGGNSNPMIHCWPRRVTAGPISFSWQARFWRRCRHFIRQSPPDTILYARHLRLADHLLRRCPGRPLIFELHEIFSENPDIPRRHAERLRAMEDRVFTQAAGLVAITRGLVSALQSRYPDLPPCALAPDGCEPPDFSREPDPAVAPADLIYAGSLHPWKGVRTLIQAMAFLPNRKLRVVGGTPAEVEALRRLARQWKASARCEWTGVVPYHQVSDHLRRAKIGVVPNHPHAISTDFTSPLKVFEYLAAGLPVLASDLPSLREVLDERVAVMFPAASPRSLAVAAEQLLSDEPGLARMSESARDRAQEFTWEKRAERIARFLQSDDVDFYERALDRSCRATA
ncbi:MAG: glycosyltransferase [Verrucomicrobiae bacterium]|nr:glycosyltransferase [Verrucomicrobiae bacterium]